MNKFVEKFKATHKDEIKDIFQTLTQIGKTTGARFSFFKPYEGKFGDAVCALYDNPEKNLRLYCIRFGTVVVILGGGSIKSKKIKSWQQDSELSKAANEMINYSQDISNRLKCKDLFWSADLSELEGNLNNIDNEEDS